MAEQGRATKQLGRLHAHVLTLRSFAREIPKPLKGLELFDRARTHWLIIVTTTRLASCAPLDFLLWCLNRRT